MRIIAGKFKGRILNDFTHEGTRPTSDKARGGIFNTLVYENEGGVFLDLFGGSGAMGIEAESRGAKKVYIIDNNPLAVKNINDNIKKCGAIITHAIKNDYKDALRYFKKNNITFDIIFIDPPYKENFAGEAVKLIMDYNLLSEDGVICYEHNKDNFVNDDRIELVKQKRYGIAEVSYYVKKDLQG